MKVFQTYEKIFAYAIVRHPETQNGFLYKWFIILKAPFINCTTTFAWIALIIYLIRDARTFQEFSETIYASVTLASTMFALSVYFVKSMEFFTLIDNFQQVIEMRK